MTFGGKRKFPLYWTSDLTSITGYYFWKLNEYERDVVFFLERMLSCNIKELLNKKGYVIKLKALST